MRVRVRVKKKKKKPPAGAGSGVEPQVSKRFPRRGRKKTRKNSSRQITPPATRFDEIGTDRDGRGRSRVKGRTGAGQEVKFLFSSHATSSSSVRYVHMCMCISRYGTGDIMFNFDQVGSNPVSGCAAPGSPACLLSFLPLPPGGRGEDGGKKKLPGSRPRQS